MLQNKKITSLQMYFVLMLSIGISNHVLLIPVLLQIAKRDSWIGAAAALLPLSLFACIQYFILKRTNRRKITEFIKLRYGKAAWLVVTIILAAYCFLISLVSVYDTVVWTKVSYLPETPELVIAVSFLVLCFCAANAGMQVIAVTSGLLLPAVIALGIFVMSANLQYKDYSLLLPAFTHGYEPAATSVVYACGGMFELVFIPFMQHHVSGRIRLLSLLLFSLILVGLTVGPLAGAIAIFGPFEAADLRYPAFDQWRMVALGKFISHLDIFSIYQWISGSFIRVSLMLFLITDVFGLNEKRYRMSCQIGLCFVLTAVMLLPVSDMAFFRQLDNHYFRASLAVAVLLTSLLLCLLIQPKTRRENGSA